jgi:aspartate-semialdehyde dehydrogenase
MWWQKVGIVGATGAVGQELIETLFRRGHSGIELHLYGSADAPAREMDTPFGVKPVIPYDRRLAGKCDVVFLAATAEFACKEALYLSARTLVVDNSSAFRNDPKVPLVVPEVNGHAISTARLISNPNCTTALLALVLGPINKAFSLNRVIVSTYQAASGAGIGGMNELKHQLLATALGENVCPPKYFRYPLAMNIIPQIDAFESNGYTKEEMKVVNESRKILNIPELQISCTSVRVPTLRAHAESVTIETLRHVKADEVRDLLGNTSGVRVIDNPEAGEYPMPITAAFQWDVQVGRIRENPIFRGTGIDLFLCGDQLLKGAALNAVQIAEVSTPAVKRD